jgi:tRNA(fMet)-specific endonuclease VapC
MTLRFLLDTNIVSVPIATKPNRKVITRLTEQSIYCAIAAPVWHELVYGCELLAESKRRRAVEDYLKTVVKVSFPILPYDEPAAIWHGRERARLEKAGKSAPFVDGQIAAIAKRHDLTLVTANPKHFALFDGLKIVDWTS